MQSKKQLTERDICTQYITPAIIKAGWNIRTQMREEVYFTDGRIIVQGKLYARGKGKKADYILYYKEWRSSKYGTPRKVKNSYLGKRFNVSFYSHFF